MKTHPITRSGFSLVEVMIAMVILVVGLSTLFDSLVTAKRVNDRATNQAKAYEEIQAQIESIQYMPYRDIHNQFKGIAFDVKGLTPPTGAVTCGTVTKLSNPNPDDTSVAPNPNRFLASEHSLPLRFRVAWMDEQGPMSLEVVYVVADRGK